MSEIKRICTKRERVVSIKEGFSVANVQERKFQNMNRGILCKVRRP